MREKIFISYSRADSEFAVRLDHDLDHAGFDSFLDLNDIKPGEPWEETIERALSDSTTVIVVLSPSSVSSNGVRDEIGYALHAKKVVIPVLYKTCDIPLRINRLHYVSFTGTYETGLGALIGALGGSPVTAAPAPIPEPRTPKPATLEPDPKSPKQDPEPTKLAAPDSELPKPNPDRPKPNPDRPEPDHGLPTVVAVPTCPDEHAKRAGHPQPAPHQERSSGCFNLRLSVLVAGLLLVAGAGLGSWRWYELRVRRMTNWQVVPVTDPRLDACMGVEPCLARKAYGDRLRQTAWKRVTDADPLLMDCGGYEPCLARKRYIERVRETAWEKATYKDPLLKDCAGFNPCIARKNRAVVLQAFNWQAVPANDPRRTDCMEFSACLPSRVSASPSLKPAITSTNVISTPPKCVPETLPLCCRDSANPSACRDCKRTANIRDVCDQ